MKILYVVDYYQPQLGYSEYFIPRELKKMGHTVWILTSNYYYPFPNYQNTSGKILGPRQQSAGITTTDGIKIIKEELKWEIFTRAIFFNHEKYLKQLKPDLVIVNKASGFNTIRMAQLKKKYKFKYITYDAHLPSGFYAEGNLLLKQVFYFLFRVLFANLINHAVDLFVAVQEETEIIMREFYGQKNIIHIPLGTDTDRFYFDNHARQAIRKQTKIAKTDFVIVYSGKLIPTKGIDILCKAFNMLAKKHTNIHLFLIGNGTPAYLDECYSYVHTSFQKRIHLIGFQENKNLYKYYSAAEVGVWPLEESTAMNDLAACKRPFIANDTIGAKIRLSNNNALLYKQHDATDLAKKIEYLYQNPQKRTQMGQNGFELIQKRLNWKSIVKEYLAYVA